MLDSILSHLTAAPWRDAIQYFDTITSTNDVLKVPRRAPRWLPDARPVGGGGWAEPSSLPRKPGFT